MTSDAKRAANRRNAQRSTGPRSAAGKARTRHNAYRHGLATPLRHDVALTAMLEPLANEFAHGSLERIVREAARAAAVAQLEMVRAQKAKLQLVTGVLPEGQAPHREHTKEEQQCLAFSARPKLCLRTV